MSDQEVQTGEVDEGGWATLIHAGLSPNMERNNWGCATSRAFREVARRTADTIQPRPICAAHTKFGAPGSSLSLRSMISSGTSSSSPFSSRALAAS